MLTTNRNRILLLAAFLGAVGTFAFSPGLAGQTAPGTLVVGTREVPPFAMRDAAGNWTGISIDLWLEITARSSWSADDDSIVFVELALGALIDSIEAKAVDVGVAAFTVTLDRERRVDFSHPFFNSGLSLAVPVQSSSPILGVAQAILSRTFLTVIGALFLILLLSGALVWFFERRRNPEQFGDGVRGLGAGFWWAAVTMTTVGYGDKSPQTGGGRTVALVWMFTSVIIISAFTAGIASALTVGILRTDIGGPDDLVGRPVGTVSGSTAEHFGGRSGFVLQSYGSLREALDALVATEVDAVVYDRPVLRFMIKEDYPGQVRILPVDLEEQDYAIMVPEGSSYLEELNQALLGAIEAGVLDNIVNRYLGVK